MSGTNFRHAPAEMYINYHKNLIYKENERLIGTGSQKSQNNLINSIENYLQIITTKIKHKNT